MNHLKQTKSSYVKHFIYASYFNIIAIGIVLTGIIHSIFPSVFPYTPYRLAKKIVEETERNFINDN
jgi:hypothetical protein